MLFLKEFNNKILYAYESLENDSSFIFDLKTKENWKFSQQQKFL